MRAGLAALVLLAGVAPAADAQSSPAYTAAALDCARFHEVARSEIETESAGRTRRFLAERDAWWSVRARDSAGGLSIEAWYDSLALRHGAPDTLAAPDTDGLVGGRYRGHLERTGRFLRLAAPFIPDEIAEATDAAAALDDLLPWLPPGPLPVNRRWDDGDGLRIERLPDSAASAGTLERYAVARRTESEASVPRGDTVPVPLRQSTVEATRVVWDPSRGLVRRERETVTDASVPAGGRVRAPVRSRVVQRSTLERIGSAACR